MNYLSGMKDYWNGRFENEDKVWGEKASTTAEYALKLFETKKIERILVPGAGYGRNTKLFGEKDYRVTGVEISDEAVKIAKRYDVRTTFYNSSVLEVKLEKDFDAVYCFNVLHLFRENERSMFIDKCHEWIKDWGYAFFTVFSEKEKSYGKGLEVEENTFESKPGRPVHYFNDEDLKKHFSKFNIIESGLMEDYENHGDEGKHTHTLRYIFVQKKTSFDFDGEKYKNASKHQKEWGNKIINELKLKGRKDP